VLVMPASRQVASRANRVTDAQGEDDDALLHKDITSREQDQQGEDEPGRGELIGKLRLAARAA